MEIRIRVQKLLEYPNRNDQNPGGPRYVHASDQAKRTGFEVTFSLSGMLSFPMGKLDILESENRVLETLCFPIEMI